jgi:hypothetical protein
MALIDREAALSMRFSEGYDKDGVMFVPLREVTDHIKAIPPAVQVEAIPVEWIEKYMGTIKSGSSAYFADPAWTIKMMLEAWQGEQEAEHDNN